MKIEMKKIVLVLFVLCAFEAHAQSLGGEIVRKKEKPTLRSAWSSTFADNHTHTKVAYKRTDKRLKVIDLDYNTYSDALKIEADKGNASAQYALSKVYAQGLGVDVDEKNAQFYLKKALESKYPAAQYTWGRLLQMGVDGVVQNTE